MSSKSRIALSICIVVFVLAAVTLVFAVAAGESVTTEGLTGRLVNTVLDNAGSFTCHDGAYDTKDVDFYRLGVYCAIYTADGTAVRGVNPPDCDFSDVGFSSSSVRNIDRSGESYYLYDAYTFTGGSGFWVRGVISATDRSALSRAVIIFACILLPVLVLVSAGAGWLIAWNALKPMETMIDTANSISDNGDLSARLDIGQKAPGEMVRLQNAFNRMLGRIERAFSAEKQFTSDASHELRTPITVILAECDRAKRKDKSREDFLETIGVIEEQGQDMAALVNRLLQLTRIEHGADRFPLASGDISTFLQACCENFVPAESRGITFSADIPDGIQARFNESLTGGILNNLLENAYKYGRDNGSVSVALRETETGAVLTVTDDGIGIAAEDLDHIWSRFWQADPSRSENGSGLGLAIVREAAIFQGGTVSCGSVPNKGSTFTVTFVKYIQDTAKARNRSF